MSDKLPPAPPAPPDDARADQEVRAMLAAYDEPAPQHLSPATQRSLLASLPTVPPAQAAAQVQRAARIRLLRRTALLLGVGVLVALGAWGVYADTDAVVGLFGGVGGTAGYLVLVLLLSIKPFAHVLAPGLSLVLLLGAVGGLWWLLQRLLRAAPPMLAAEHIGVEP